MSISNILSWHPKLLILPFWVLMFLCPFIQPVSAVEPVNLQENKFKAGLLYNFLKYSNWPDSSFNQSQGALRICLFGGDTFEGALDLLHGRTAQKRVIQISEIHKIKDTYKCHIVFINRSHEENLAPILKELDRRPIMTMSDIRNFSTRGGMVELSAPQASRIKLYINIDAIHQANLTVDESLIRLSETRE